MTRSEHMAWAKQRALNELTHSGPEDAFASMASDLNKHPETENHIGLQLGMLQMMGGMLNDRDGMRSFIEGFN